MRKLIFPAAALLLALSGSAFVLGQPGDVSDTIGPVRAVLVTGGHLGPGDLKLAPTGAYHETWPLRLQAGEEYTVRMSSDDFIPHVWVQPRGPISPKEQIGGAVAPPIPVLASIRADFTFRAPVTGQYLLVAGAVLRGRGGFYQLKAWQR